MEFLALLEFYKLMKNKLVLILIDLVAIIFFTNSLLAENIQINAKNILIDKKKQITTFKDNVEIVDENKNIIKSNFARYNKISDFFELKENVI